MPSRHTVPAMVKPRFDEIVGLIETVCLAHLTQEDATVARELAAALARKRPSPLLRGQAARGRVASPTRSAPSTSCSILRTAACAWQRSVRIFR